MRFFALLLFGLIAATIADDSETYYYSIDTSESGSNESAEERIAGGNVVIDLKKFNYQVGLLNVKEELITKTSMSWKYGACGGSLIHPQVVLTAAHCVVAPIYVAVYYGTVVRQTNPRAESNIRCEPRDIESHADYKIGSNDIALINLPVAIRTSDYIAVIQLASYAFMSCDQPGWISGWGLTSSDENSAAPELKSLFVSPLSYDKCRQRAGIIQRQHLCIDGAAYTGTCQGDSGGPYVQTCPTNGAQYLCGIVSFGVSEDCINNGPKVFTSVGYYKDNNWICEKSRRRVGC